MAKVGDRAPEFAAKDWKGNGVRLADLRASGPAVLVFLRYTGCPICQLRIAELAREHERFVRAGARVAVVVESPAESVRRFAAGREFPFVLLPDPDRALYRAYGVEKGGIAAILSPRVIAEVIRARLAGHKHGKFEGTETQVPADFVVGRDGLVRHARYGRHVADSTPIADLLRAVESA